METNVRYTLAGTFVLIMLSLLVIITMWITSGFSREKYSYYTVYMKENVTGLAIKGRVVFNGVEVGTIDDMLLNKNKPRIVELRLKIKSNTPITRGTRATLGIKALSGASYLLLEDEGKDIKPLLAKKNEPYPVIETEPSMFVRLDKMMDQVSDGFQGMNRSFQKISSTMQSVFSRETIQALKRALNALSNLGGSSKPPAPPGVQ